MINAHSIREGLVSQRRLRIYACTLLTLLAALSPRIWADNENDGEIQSAAKLHAAIGQMAPDFTFQASDSRLYRVSDFKGKWLLLQFGGSWCRPSESTAQTFSFIRKALEGKPFEFIEIYQEPGIEDVLLNSLTDFHGIRAVVPDGQEPEFYQVGSIPVWYLIDPTGIIRLDGQYIEADEAMAKFTELLKNSPEFANIASALSPQDALYLTALNLSHGKKWKEASTAWEEVLKSDASNPYALAHYARSIAWIKGYPESCKVLAEKIKMLPQPPADFLKFFQSLYLLSLNNRTEGIRNMEKLQKSHPNSVCISSLMLTLTKTPEELTHEESKLLASSVELYQAIETAPFYAYVAERDGKLEMAAKYFGAEDFKKGLRAFGLAGMLHRLGQDAPALQLLGASNPPSPETANKAQAWEIAMDQVIVGDWAKASLYAQRYEQHQPARGEGPLFQLLAALRSGDKEKSKELRTHLEQVLSTNYKTASLIGGEGPSRDQLAAIGNENERMDIALSAYLFAEMDGQMQKASNLRRAALNAFSPGLFAFHLIHNITTPPSEADFKERAKIAGRMVELKGFKATLDAEDAKLMSSLGISSNNTVDTDKVGAYFVGKLSPVYADYKTNSCYPALEKYRQQLKATFVLAAGLKSFDQLAPYCASNNIAMEDLNAYLNGVVVNDLCYQTTPVSEAARKQYIALTESCLTNTTTFFSTPYKNWDTFSAFLERQRSFIKAKTSPTPTPTPLASPSASPSSTPAPSPPRSP